MQSRAAAGMAEGAGLRCCCGIAPYAATSACHPLPHPRPLTCSAASRIAGRQRYGSVSTRPQEGGCTLSRLRRALQARVAGSKHPLGGQTSGCVTGDIPAIMQKAGPAHLAQMSLCRSHATTYPRSTGRRRVRALMSRYPTISGPTSVCRSPLALATALGNTLEAEPQGGGQAIAYSCSIQDTPVLGAAAAPARTWAAHLLLRCQS